jgi:hypothetical protein
MSTISTPALRRLQTLYAQFERRSLDGDNSREARLAWATERLGKPVASFSALTSADGKFLIDALQLSMNIGETSKRQRKSTRDRQKEGTEGRRDQLHPDTTLLDGSERVLRLIQQEMSALGWNKERLLAFLRSPSGPNQHRDTILTLGDANRIHFALKRMSRRKSPQEAAA